MSATDGDHELSGNAKRASETRSRLLAAALEIVGRDGVLSLTLARVADEAGVSKGGLLYHFATKEDLLAALLEQTLGSVSDTLENLVEPDQQVGAFSRAYLNYVRRDGTGAADSAKSLFAAAALQPGLMTSTEELFEGWQQRLMNDDGLDPTMALMARVVGDGLWLIDLFNLAPPTIEERNDLIDKVTELIMAEVPASD